MSTQNKRLMVTVTDDMASQLDGLKQREFYNRSQSDMLRHLIRLGLKSKEAGYEASIAGQQSHNRDRRPLV